MADSPDGTLAAINDDHEAVAPIATVATDRVYDTSDGLARWNAEDLARALDGTAGYRVLRELPSRIVFQERDGRHALRGLVVDVETTGLDPKRDEIIEAAILPFHYTLEGDVLETAPPFIGLRQPSKPIPPAITRITGITDATVAGLSILPEAVDEFVGEGGIVVCHNASFDRPFLERSHPRFEQLPWACSLTQVPWRDEGFPGARLSDLALGHGAFFQAHRAIDDCRALLEILSRRLPESGVTGLCALLQAARKPSFRVWAVGAPFDSRELLRSNGYRWNPGDDGRRRAWSKEVGAEALEPELDYLTSFFFDGMVSPVVEELNAHRRFSTRA